MSTLKPFYVTLTYSAVVMAVDFGDAERVADHHSFEIVSDAGDPDFEAVTELRSIAHMRSIDSGWEADCCAYGGHQPTLRDVLPEEDPPVRDTHTQDMFAAGGASMTAAQQPGEWVGAAMELATTIALESNGYFTGGRPASEATLRAHLTAQDAKHAAVVAALEGLMVGCTRKVFDGEADWVVQVPTSKAMEAAFAALALAKGKS